MIPNRVSTAQIADELLNEFYVKNNHDMLRRKHHRKVKKKLMQRGALSPLQSLHLSQSLENFDQIDSNFSRKLSRSGSRPLSKSVSFEESSLNADRDSHNGRRKVKYEPSSGSIVASDSNSGTIRGRFGSSCLDESSDLSKGEPRQASARRQAEYNPVWSWRK